MGFRTLLAAILVVFVSPLMADETADRALYREVLFHIYNDDDLSALTLLENSGTGANHIGNPFHNKNHLFAVQANLQLGLYAEAAHILEHLQFTTRDEVVQDVVGLYWGKLHYFQGHWPQAVEALEKVGPKAPRESKDEAYYYLAMSYMHLNKTEKAAPLLAKMSEKSMWSAYAYYNLAMEYTKTDADPSRPLIALRVAAAMTNASEEGQAMEDRINLTAGYLSLQANEYDKAVSFLKKVRVKSETAPSAIYAYGLAYSGLGRYRSAVQTWHRAKTYSLVIPGVAESFQAIAYGFEKENLRSSAIESYLEGITVYEKELVQLDTLIGDVEKRGALEVLLEDQPRQDVEWFLLTDVVTNTPKVGFISYLMADPEFYDQAKTLLELRNFQHKVEQGSHRLDVFERMLKDRQKGFNGRAGVGLSQDRIAKLNRLISQRNELVKSFEVAERDRDFMALAPAQLAERMKRVDQLESRLSRSGSADQKERVRLLKGMLIWQAMTDFDANRQARRSEMEALDEQINLYRENLKSFQEKTQRGPEQYRSQLDRIAALKAKSSNLQAQLNADIRARDQSLTQLASEQLKKHRSSMSRFKLESQMALVNLFDDLAIVQYSKKVSAKGQALKEVGKL